MLSMLSRYHTDRRLRQVERDPRTATVADLELLVRAHGVPAARSWVVTDRLESGAFAPALVWTWAMAFDGVELTHLCGSALTDAEVLAHLEAQTAPDRFSLVACDGWRAGLLRLATREVPDVRLPPR